MLLLTVAMLADLLTFAWAMTLYPIGAESNPLARAAYEAAGLAGVAGLKLAAIPLALGILAALTRWPVTRRRGMRFAVAFTLFGVASNLVAVGLA